MFVFSNMHAVSENLYHGAAYSFVCLTVSSLGELELCLLSLFVAPSTVVSANESTPVSFHWR